MLCSPDIDDVAQARRRWEPKDAVQVGPLGRMGELVLVSLVVAGYRERHGR